MILHSKCVRVVLPKSTKRWTVGYLRLLGLPRFSPGGDNLNCNSNGQVLHFVSTAVNFGDDIEPGAAGVFETFSIDPNAQEIFYFITWGRFSDKDETPYTQVLK